MTQTKLWPVPRRWWLYQGHPWRESASYDSQRPGQGPKALVQADLDLFLREMEEGRR